MTFGTMMLTLRKFQDLASSGQLNVDETAPAIEWVLHECAKHKTRDAANLLFAHYAERRQDPPLSQREITALIEAGGWATEEEVVEWSQSIIDRLREIRDAVMVRYGITILDEQEALIQ